jgi:hypothetical protein
MSPREDYLLTHDLVGVFQVGWSILYQEVCMPATRLLIDVLGKARVSDDDLQGALNLLRVRLMREERSGTPWRAAPALDVMTGIDLPAWAALVGLIAECPVIHGGLIATIDSSVRSVDPHAFEFFSAPQQLALIESFMRSLSRLF